jgi:hypothetical protein
MVLLAVLLLGVPLAAALLVGVVRGGSLAA